MISGIQKSSQKTTRVEYVEVKITLQAFQITISGAENPSQNTTGTLEGLGKNYLIFKITTVFFCNVGGNNF